MTTESIRHNLDFIASCKPMSHPVNTHLLAIDTRGMPAELFHDAQQALLDSGLRYHLQAVRQGQLLCFDRDAYDFLSCAPMAAQVPVEALYRTAAAE